MKLGARFVEGAIFRLMLSRIPFPEATLTPFLGSTCAGGGFFSNAEAPGTFNGRPDPSIRHPGIGGWDPVSKPGLTP